MEAANELLSWVQQWYSSQCDGDWEHGYGVKINTIDNPGWSVEIDLSNTLLADLYINWKLTEDSPHDWWGYSVKNGIYNAAGDPDKLAFLLHHFRILVTSKIS